MPSRVRRRRVKGWRKPENCVIVDRTSRFGNPFTIARARDEFGYDETEARRVSVAKFAPWLAGDRGLWRSDEADLRRERILAGLPSLRGRDLACPCPEGEPCHAVELIRVANLPESELAAWVADVRAAVDRNRKTHGEKPLEGVEG